jgi:adenylate cyclase class IV
MTNKFPMAREVHKPDSYYEAKHQEMLKKDPHYRARFADGTLTAGYARRHGVDQKGNPL